MAAQCRHCRHRDDAASVLPAKAPVVPAITFKTKTCYFYLGKLNNSRKSIKFRESLHKVRKLTIFLFGFFSKLNMV